MALADLQAFIDQCLSNVDPTLDLSPGSPYDVGVVQPILQRLGTDPFTVDIGLFIQTTLNQQFPDMPTSEGDAFTDLFIKAAVVLWNPIVREITRVANNLSFQNPQILTVAEAQALGANLFATLDQGNLATGVVRVYFAQPQNISISPANFITDNQGLHFFPTEIQSIGVTEMLLNVEGTLYYFDVNIIAEAAGSQYNDIPNSVVTIANVTSAVRITNKANFASGTPPQTAPQFVAATEQSLTERSMVTLRGIAAQLTTAFPQLTTLNVRGFNDPEMQRDIITGGGLGPVIASAILVGTEPDGSGAVLTRRFIVDPTIGVDFVALIGPPGPAPAGFVITAFNLFPPATLPIVQDLHVLTVIDSFTVDVVEQVMRSGVIPSITSGAGFTLRKNVLTLSGIPGGIIFPNQPDGTVQIPDGTIHIGGCTDIYVLDPSTTLAQLIITDIVDDQPVLQGVELNVLSTTVIQLSDLVLGTNYSLNDATYLALANAPTNNLSIQILDPPDAGGYRITSVTQFPGSSPLLTVLPALSTVVGGNFRWTLSDSIYIDLLEPKETRVSGSDLRTILGSPIITTVSGTDFDNYGVSVGDTLRITSGTLILGDYIVTAVDTPFFAFITVDRPLAATVNGASYYIFRSNSTGGLIPPFLRVDSIALLDTSSQPVGTTIPYARPINVESNGFANSANGIKADITDGVLGIVFGGNPLVPLNVSGMGLQFLLPGVAAFTATFSGPNPLTPGQIVAQINAASAGGGGPSVLAEVLNDGNQHIGIIPAVADTQVTGGTAFATLFGVPFTIPVSTRDITSAQADQDGGWAALRPALDSDFDVAQTLDGTELGFFWLANGANEPVPNAPFVPATYDPLRTRTDFNPQVDVRVQVGSRSLGTVRLFFLDPTSFQIDAFPAAVGPTPPVYTVFTLTGPDGSVLNFFADPTDNYQAIPALPSGAKPLDGMTDNAIGTPPPNTFQSLSTDFLAAGVQTGDLLVIDFVPVTAPTILNDPVGTGPLPGASMNGAVLLIALGDGGIRAITFINDSTTIASYQVTRAGVVSQINAAVGQTICALNAFNQIVFNPTVAMTIFGSSAPNSANVLLGFPLLNGTDVSNRAPDAGTYAIAVVAPGGNVNQLQVTPVFPTTDFPSGPTGSSNEQFSVLHAGVQRIVSTTMATQTDIGGLYYFDVTLVSEGTGNQYDIAAGQQMTVAGYKSDGYYLTTANPNLTFSSAEEPSLYMSLSILPVGVSDDPANAVQLSGQNIQVNYDQSSLVQNVSNFVTSDTERVVCESSLARHLIPYYVRFDLTYFGGSNTNVVVPAIDTYITGLAPTDTLEVSSLNNIVLSNGATAVQNPVTLVAVIHGFDRSISVEQSQDSLNTGVLAAFIPDVLNITRNVAS
jgi:hypothetical protein